MQRLRTSIACARIAWEGDKLQDSTTAGQINIRTGLQEHSLPDRFSVKLHEMGGQRR